MEEIKLIPIGTIHSPFKDRKGMPIQPTAASGISGSVEIKAEYSKGLKDLEGFSHIYLIYYFHLSEDYSLEVKPFMDDNLRGLFATRAPKRPNPIGLSIVKLLKIEDNILYIEDIDIVDGTPLLDIKPYVPKFDYRDTEQIGWLTENINKLPKIKSDNRFIG